MAQSLAKIYVHIIFSTKARRVFMKDDGVRKEMHAYLASILKAYDSPAVIVGGTADHVHVLCVMSKTHAAAKIIGEIKRGSSKWIKSKGEDYAEFQWQNGYGAFSVSHPNVSRVRRYIGHQEEHHKTVSFKDEFQGLLKKQGIDFDERYVWD